MLFYIAILLPVLAAFANCALFDTSGATPFQNSDCLDCYEAVNLNYSYRFFDESYTTIYVANNGYVTFDAGYTWYSPDYTSAFSPPIMLAPYWSDIDLRTNFNSTITFEETQASDLLAEAKREIERRVFPGCGDLFEPTSLFIATWENVPSYCSWSTYDDGYDEYDVYYDSFDYFYNNDDYADYYDYVSFSDDYSYSDDYTDYIDNPDYSDYDTSFSDDYTDYIDNPDYSDYDTSYSDDYTDYVDNPDYSDYDTSYSDDYTDYYDDPDYSDYDYNHSDDYSDYIDYSDYPDDYCYGDYLADYTDTSDYTDDYFSGDYGADYMDSSDYTDDYFSGDYGADYIDSSDYTDDYFSGDYGADYFDSSDNPDDYVQYDDYGNYYYIDYTDDYKRDATGRHRRHQTKQRPPKPEAAPARKSHFLVESNTFQVVLATDGCDTFAIINYDEIQWTFCHYNNKMLFNAGNDVGFYLNPEVQLDGDTNVHQQGRWVYKISESKIREPGCQIIGT